MDKSRSPREKRPQASVIVAAYNIDEGVSELADTVVTAMSGTGRSFEVLFIDDGSTDRTFETLKEKSTDSRIRVIRMRSTFGEAAALEAGLKYSLGEEVAFISGRVRVAPEGLPVLFNALDSGGDFIVGWRYPRRDSLLNRIISRMFNSMACRLSRIRLHDINSGIFVTRKSVLSKVSFYGDLYNFLPVLAAQQGYKVREVKVEQLHGMFRKSKYPKEYVQRILDIITVFFLSRYSKKPIHFLGFLGTFLFLVGLAIELYLFVYRILLIGPIAGRPLLILGALLLVIGIQMISIGLLGEMVIFTHAGEIEEYNIEEIIN
ncbi:glycosyltransferase [bacterium]|nr:glycosyltransferase [bacterium]